jgi:patatin-like phospholipase/acyl hydrolase
MFGMFKTLQLLAVSASLLVLSSNGLIASYVNNNNETDEQRQARMAALHGAQNAQPLDAPPNPQQTAYNPKNWGHLFERHLLNRAQFVPENPIANQNPLVVWSFDGGGVLGILGAHTYAVADQVVKLLKAQNPNLKDSIYDYIDVFAGTSTGGIFTIAANLPGPDGRPKLSPIELYRLYRFYGPEIFKKHVGYHLNPMGWAGTKYNHRYIEDLLQDYCLNHKGEQILYSDLLKPVFVTAYSMSGDEGILLSSTDSDQIRDLCAWQVGRATSAAPTYFDPIELTVRGEKHTLVDGGVWENDPGVKVLEEMVQYYGVYAKSKNPEHPEQVILKMISSGAGFTGLGVKINELTNSSALLLLNKLLVSLFNAREKSVLGSLQHYRELSKAGLSHNHFGIALLDYQRFQPELEAHVKALDNIEPAALEVLTGVSKNNCMGESFQTMLSRLLNVEIDQVKNIMAQALKGVEEAAARADLSKNDYYSHLPWIYEYTQKNAAIGLLGQFDFKKYFAEKVRVSELAQDGSIENRLVKAQWLASFLKHNMHHDLLKTIYSGVKDCFRTGAHRQAEYAVCDLIGDIFKQSSSAQEWEGASESFDRFADVLVSSLSSIFEEAGAMDGHMRVYQDLTQRMIELSGSLPKGAKVTLLKNLRAQLQKSQDKRSFLSSAVAVLKKSWHDTRIEEIDARLLEAQQEELN